jgi:hypothetical protein
VGGAVLISLALLSAHGQPADAAPDAEVLRRAEEAFRQGSQLRAEPERARPSFVEAAQLYGELEKRGAHNPSLYLNLGNSRLLADDLPGAIVAYRRGLRLAPYDHDLEAALERARGRVLFPQGGDLGRTPSELWPVWLPRLGSGCLLGLAAAAYALAWVAGTYWRLTKRRWALGAAIAAALATPTGTALGVEVLRREAEAAGRTLVVVNTGGGVLLRKGNGWLKPGEPAYPPRYPTPLPPGVEARLLASRGDWLQVELAGGEAGWLPAAAVVVDAP